MGAMDWVQFFAYLFIYGLVMFVIGRVLGLNKGNYWTRRAGYRLLGCVLLPVAFVVFTVIGAWVSSWGK